MYSEWDQLSYGKRCDHSDGLTNRSKNEIGAVGGRYNKLIIYFKISLYFQIIVLFYFYSFSLSIRFFIINYYYISIFHL